MARLIAPPWQADRADPTAFIAVDVETANAETGSICQIGFARFAGGALIDNWSWLIHPQTFFSEGNIRVHGIRPGHVSHAPDWRQLHDVVAELLSDRVVVSHSGFDVTAISRAAQAIGRAPITARWLDSVRVARRAFPGLRGAGGHGLAHLKTVLQLEFTHHDAAEDARAAGWVLEAAVSATGIGVADWLTAVHRPVAEFR